MNENLLHPDYIFEVSWEVCNKVGGIHTVVSTKALTLVKELKENLILIGPDIWRETGKNPEFVEDENLFKAWRIKAKDEGFRIRIGRWNIVGKPLVILVDFSPFITKKDEIFKEFWELYKLDSISGHWDYVEPATFGYAAGKVIENFCRFNLTIREKVVAQFHEWMTGTGILYLHTHAPQIATLFTTHATVLGRAIAGNRQPLYRLLTQYNGDVKAREFNVVAKYSLEKISAQVSDCFTTVSEITARECKQFLEKDADMITPNGFEDNFVPNDDEFEFKRNLARTKLLDVCESLVGYNIPDDSILIATSGRYEFWNKGIDVFIDVMGKLNQRGNLNKTIIAFILVPANNYGARKDLLERMGKKTPVSTEFNKFLTHGLHDSEYDAVLKKVKQVGLTNGENSHVKIVFVPSYLNGNDGIFNLNYWDILIGFDMTVFPSYYEPYGYTPLESLAFHIPTITTTLTGFGKWIMNQVAMMDECVGVVERNDDNYQRVVEDIANKIIICSYKSGEDKKRARENAYFLSKTALWRNLIKYYKEAFHIALKKVSQRSDKFSQAIQTQQVTPVKISKTNRPVWRSVSVRPNLSGKLQGLNEIAQNLWWAWENDAKELYEYIINPNGEGSAAVCINPIAILKGMSYERLMELENDEVFVEKYNNVYSRFKKYINEPRRNPKIAYFCMEFGLANSLKIYSGGLGILAGDYLKEASDSNVDMVGIGLLYKYGYFNQQLTLKGEQLTVYDAQNFAELPVSPVLDEKGNQRIVQLAFPGRFVFAQIWKVEVGRVTLYLLDTDRKDNLEQDRSITSRLYGGDSENRLKQEMILGVGGIRALETMNVRADIYHCNEGHAAFMGIERLHRFINKKNFTFSEALEIVRASSLFTTHTPVPAGHDVFPDDLIMMYMGHYPERLKISWQEFIHLGKIESSDKFSMSNLAARLSQEINGVSMLHGDVTKKMFNALWDGYYPQELHVNYVTNGVHYHTWTAQEWKELYEKEFGKTFLADQSNKELWNRIHKVADKKIWDIRQDLRAKLISYLHDRLDSDWVQRREDPKDILKLKNSLNENALTIGFARRFATYKRPNLLFRDLDALLRIVHNSEKPVQIFFAGKAHPNDGGGQAMIKEVNEIAKRPEFLGKIIFWENYDIQLAKRLVQGVDIWLNTPTRPLEASGTSGMKAVMNGCLHFSVLDGWWVEGYREGAGWALDQRQIYQNLDFQNDLDSQTIYRKLENEIIPMFYDRDKNGVPVDWVRFIKKSIAEVAPQFTMKRMLDDYFNKYYNKMAARNALLRENDFAIAKKIAAWKKKVARSWDSIEVENFYFSTPMKESLLIGEKYEGEIVLDLNELADTNIGVEMLVTEFLPDGSTNILEVKELQLTEIKEHKAHYKIDLVPPKPGNFNYGFRVFPKNELLPHRQDFNYVRWI